MTLLHILGQISELDCDRSLRVDYACHSIESYLKDRFPNIQLDFTSFTSALVEAYFGNVRPSLLALAETKLLKQQAANLHAAGEPQAAMKLQSAIQGIERDCQSSIERFREMAICKFNEYLEHDSAVYHFASELTGAVDNQPCPRCNRSKSSIDTESHRVAFMAVLAEQ